MKRFLLTTLALLALSLAFFIAALPASAHAATRSTQASSHHAVCHTLLVTLHGTAPATMSCRDRTSNPISPRITTNNACGTYGALKLYQDSGFEGNTLCFLGTGFANMTDYWIFWPFTSWNDQVSSYNAGCNDGAFYANTGGTGQTQSFSQWASANLDGQSGRLPNDSLSSLQIFSTGGCY